MLFTKGFSKKLIITSSTEASYLTILKLVIPASAHTSSTSEAIPSQY